MKQPIFSSVNINNLHIISSIALLSMQNSDAPPSSLIHQHLSYITERPIDTVLAEVQHLLDKMIFELKILKLRYGRPQRF